MKKLGKREADRWEKEMYARHEELLETSPAYIELWDKISAFARAHAYVEEQAIAAAAYLAGRGEREERDDG